MVVLQRFQTPRFQSIHMVRAAAVLIAFAFVGAFELRSASAQVVQLPTFRSFGIGTTVVVPDGGSALLGSVSRGQSGSVSRGVPGLGGIPGAGRLFRNQATSGSFGTSTVTVHATIIDTEELDKAVLAEAAAIRAARDRRDRAAGITVLDEDQQRRADFLNRHMGRRNR